jgi:hypothetical protein
MGKEAGKRPRHLLDQEWANALHGMTKEIQAAKKLSGLSDLGKTLQFAANSPAAKLIEQLKNFAATPAGDFLRRAQEFANSPLGKQWAEMAKNVMAANERAKHLSDLIHSARDLTEIQTAIDAEPVDAYALLALVHLERDKEAGELEKRLAEQNREARSEQGRQLARLLHANSPHARIKPEIIRFYEDHAGELKPDGRPRFKNKAAFVREIFRHYEDTVTDPDTISKWIAESPFKVPHWRTRATTRKS